MGKIKKPKDITNTTAGLNTGSENRPVRKSSTNNTTATALKSTVIPRGRSKSGRIWKPLKNRASSVRKSSRREKKVVKRQEEREEAKKVKELSDVLKNAKRVEMEERRHRIAENKRKKEENSKKSEIVQVITNPAKLKRMKKKQLRKIEKRDTTTLIKKKK